MRRATYVIALAMAIFFLARQFFRASSHQAVSAAASEPSPKRSETVRVAAVQCYSSMGKVTLNRRMLTDLIMQAAQKGAKIVVLPECAVQGYMEPNSDTKWCINADPERNEKSVEDAAESVPGPSTHYFAALSQKLGIYLALPLIEQDQGHYFNTLLLLDPHGRIAAHHRKFCFWAPGDSGWATEGSGKACVVATEYGRLGLMICYDVHGMPSRLKAARADIVLYAVGWYGPHTENWFRDIFPRRYVTPNQFAVVAANWSADDLENSTWEGVGYSCVIARDAQVLAMASTSEPEIVIADVPVSGKIGEDSENQDE